MEENKKEDIQWITVNGKHIPIKPGESKKDAISKAFSEDRDGWDDDDNEEEYNALMKKASEETARVNTGQQKEVKGQGYDIENSKPEEKEAEKLFIEDDYRNGYYTFYYGNINVPLDAVAEKFGVPRKSIMQDGEHWAINVNEKNIKENSPLKELIAHKDDKDIEEGKRLYDEAIKAGWLNRFDPNVHDPEEEFKNFNSVLEMHDKPPFHRDVFNKIIGTNK